MIEAARWQHLDNAVAGGYEVVESGQCSAEALQLDGTWEAS